MNLKNRVIKLEEKLGRQAVMVKLAGGRTATLPGGLELLRVFCDALEGKDTPEVGIALAAESSDEQGRIIELMQCCRNGPMVQ